MRKREGRRRQRQKKMAEGKMMEGIKKENKGINKKWEKAVRDGLRG